MTLHPPGKAIGSARLAGEKTRCTPAHWTIVLRGRWFLSLTIFPYGPSHRLWHTPLTSSVRARARPQPKPDAAPSLSQVQLWPVPGTEKKPPSPRHRTAGVPSRARNWQNKTEPDSTFPHDPLDLPIWHKALAYNWRLMDAPSGSWGVLRMP